MKKLLLALVILPLMSLAQKEKLQTLQELRNDGYQDSAVQFLLDNYYQFYSADFERTLRLLQWADSTSRENGWPEKVAYVSLYRGVVHYLSGDYEPAHREYLNALSIFDSLNNPRGKARTYNEMAVFYHKTDEKEKAPAILAKAYRLARKAGDSVAMGTAQGHRAAFLMRQDKYEEARPYIEEVFAIRQSMQDSVGLGYVYLDLAEFQLHDDNLDSAVALIQKSSGIRQKLGDKQGVVVNTVIVGETYFAAQEYEQAIPYFKETIREAAAIGYADLQRFAYDMLQKSYLELGEYKLAYENLAQSQRVKDSIFNIQKARAISELETQYETEKKDQQIALQSTRIAEQEAQNQRNLIFIVALIIIVALLIILFVVLRNRYQKKQELLRRDQQLKLQKVQIEAALKSQENERRRVAQDLHDGFGQLISSLRLNLEGFGDVNHWASQQADELLTQMHSEIRNTAFNLMPEVLIRSGLVPAVRELALRINQTGKVQVEVMSHDFEQRLTEIREISLYRVIQEWLNNVLKYSGATEITIQFVKHEEELNLTIEDNGQGFDPAVLEKGRGNGWRNIQSRVEFIGGEMEVDSQPQYRGTTFIVMAPLASAVAEEKDMESVAALN